MLIIYQPHLTRLIVVSIYMRHQTNGADSFIVVVHSLEDTYRQCVFHQVPHMYGGMSTVNRTCQQ